MRALAITMVLLGCDHAAETPNPDAPVVVGDDASPTVDAPPAPLLGTVVGGPAIACPQGVPQGAICRRISVTSCPGIESAPLDATVAVLAVSSATTRGTIAHFSGGSGTGFQTQGTAEYAAAGFRQVYIAWSNDWENTPGHGIKAAGCRPATVLKWIFDEPSLHAGSRQQAFCGEGFSAGSAQLGYALAHYGLGDYLDYVNELSGPPFARIDLGCDGDAPATMNVCGAEVTMRLPEKVTGWENATVACGSTAVPTAELARWNADSIAVGGTYSYPRTKIAFFGCTNNATAVTAMAKLFHDQILAASNNDATRVSYSCYSQADGCQGEGLGNGYADARDAMIAGCVPRH